MASNDPLNLLVKSPLIEITSRQIDARKIDFIEYRREDGERRQSRGTGAE